MMAREAKMSDIAIWALYAFLMVGACFAIIASWERMLGRPILGLLGSRAVRRNRAFAIVLAVMTVLFLWTLIGALRMQVCSHCDYPYAWQHPARILESLVMAFGVSGAAGWIVFAMVSVACSGVRFIARVRSN